MKDHYLLLLKHTVCEKVKLPDKNIIIVQEYIKYYSQYWEIQNRAFYEDETQKKFLK